MKAWNLLEKGIDGLTLKDVEPAPLKAGEARLKMLAASLNYRDLLMIRGHYDPRMTLPMIPLSDGVGEVVEVGPGVTRVKVGDRVAGAFAPRWIAGPPRRSVIRHSRGWPLPGMLTEEHVCEAEGLVAVPEFLSDVQAATLPCAALTAWSALVDHGGLCAGQTVLIQGTGGVSLFALQFAVLHGARAIVTSSSDEKLERARAMGAAATFNYKTESDWGKKAAALTDEGVDLVVEVGGANTIDQSLRAVRPGGIIAMIGILGGVKSEVNLVKILMSEIRLQGVLVGHRTGFEMMNDAVAAARLEPVVDRVFPFAEAPDALRYLESGAHFGKVSIQIG
ncbi:MAG: NAD(P)-dependent alcohol dehydrogenase [Myxococcota bacterium]